MPLTDICIKLLKSARAGLIFTGILILPTPPIFSQETASNPQIFGDIPDYGENYMSPDFVKVLPPNIILVTCRTSNELLKLVDEKPVSKLKLPSHPSGLAVTSDGKTAYVTCAAPSGKLLKINIDGMKIEAEVDAFHMPRAVELSPDGKKLYVANQFEGLVRIYDTQYLALLGQCKAVREPFSLAPSPDGKKLFILNQLPEAKGGLYEENIASAVSVYSIDPIAPITQIALPNGSINGKKIIITKDGRFCICTHSVARFNVPTTQVERGWINTNAISIIDAVKNTLIATVLLDDIELGAANPYGIDLYKGSLVVAHAGSHEISIIDLVGLLKKIDDDYKKSPDRAKVFDAICNDLSYLSGLRKRVKLNGFGPRHISASNGIAYTGMYYSDFLEAIPLNNPVSRKISIGGNENLNEIRRGDLFYHDASLCFQHWLSCVTCHTEVRSDALNWDLLNDGMGNPKQSKSMLYSHFTPPSMITGVRENAKIAVRKGIQYIQFARRPEKDSVAIDKYLMSLKEIPSPHLTKDGKMNEAAARGEVIFEEAGCSHCHSGEYYTDMQKHDVGSGLDEYKNFAFDTPTLCEVWRTAPYLYDGRARTIFDMFKKFNPNDKHGKTSHLTDDELRDLEAYVLTL